MTYQEERLARLRRQRSRQAIDLAMQGCWQEAITANKAILEDFSTDVDAYNRLGRAYIELGNYAQAREAYSRATELDPYNAIAKKNLQRLNYLGEAVIGSGGKYRKVAPHQFIEGTYRFEIDAKKNLSGGEFGPVITYETYLVIDQTSPTVLIDKTIKNKYNRDENLTLIGTFDELNLRRIEVH